MVSEENDTAASWIVLGTPTNAADIYCRMHRASSTGTVLQLLAVLLCL